MGIQHDLAIGRVGENLVRKLFTSQYRTELAAPRSTYDVEVFNPLGDCGVVYSAKSGKPSSLQIEVKYDLYAPKTGNIAIEVFNPKTQKNSGIRVSTSQLWAQVLPTQDANDIWITHTDWLRTYIAEVPPKKIMTNRYNNATLRLFDKEKILPAIFVLLTPENLPSYMVHLNESDTDQWVC